MRSRSATTRLIVETSRDPRYSGVFPDPESGATMRASGTATRRVVSRIAMAARSRSEIVINSICVGGGVSHSHNGMDNANGGGFSLIDWGIFNPIDLEFTGKATIQYSVFLGVGGIYGVSEAIQEVGLCNLAPRLRNQLLPKSVHAVLGVLGIPNMVLILF